MLYRVVCACAHAMSSFKVCSSQWRRFGSEPATRITFIAAHRAGPARRIKEMAVQHVIVKARYNRRLIV